MLLSDALEEALILSTRLSDMMDTSDLVGTDKTMK